MALSQRSRRPTCWHAGKLHRDGLAGVDNPAVNKLHDSAVYKPTTWGTGGTNRRWLMIAPNIQLLATVAIGALASVATVVGIAALVRLQNVRHRLAEVEVALALGDEHYQGLSAGALGQSQRLLQLEQDFGRLRSRVEELASSGNGAGTAFNQAIHMASQGRSAQEIMDACGLGQIEADLVVLMHKSGRMQ